MFGSPEKFKAPFSSDPRTKWSREYAAREYEIPERFLHLCKCKLSYCHGWNHIGESVHLITDEEKEDNYMSEKVKAKIAEIEIKFKEIEEKRQAAIKQKTDIEAQINEYWSEQVRLQGAYRELSSLLVEAGQPVEEAKVLVGPTDGTK